MNIAILTFHDALNVGAVLQAYALQEYLKNEGHTVSFINYSCRPKFALRRIVGRNLRNTLNKIRDFIQFTKYANDKSYNSVLNVLPNKFLATDDLTVFDAFIVGSDQVWNFKQNIDSTYLLSFVPKGSLKIAYAPSMGQCEVNPSLVPKLKDELDGFDKISCREDNGVEFLESVYDHKRAILKCVDPTLLLPNKKYYEIAENIPVKRKYIASYILSPLNETQLNIIHRIEDLKKLKVLNLRNPDTGVVLKDRINKIVKPSEWLGYLKNAEFIICGSFHATVFALIFHKPFIVIEDPKFASKGGNKRIRSLLNPLCLTDRICNSPYDVEKIINSQIDWKAVDEKIKELSEESKAFLKF